MDSADVHAPRREPNEAEGPLDLQAAADELLAEAGQHLQDHVAPGPTTLLGVRGIAVLTRADSALTLTDGVWASCPAGSHALEAISDAVVLLTVAPSEQTALTA